MPDPVNGPFAGRVLHFVGIGGAGMSGLALVARELGATVTAPIRRSRPYCERFREAGIEPAIGHDDANLPEAPEVVVSTAIPHDNPELAAARTGGATVSTAATSRRLSRDEADNRRGRHAREDHEGVQWSPLRCSSQAGSRRSLSAASSRGGHECGLGGGGMGGDRGDESDRSFLKLAATSR